MTVENWKPVAGYEGIYEVSDLGNVRSLARKDSRGSLVRGRVLKANSVGNYRAVDLYKDGKRKLSLVHRLVAGAFILNPADLPQVNHVDGDPSHNAVGNLEWTTGRDNVIHAMHTLGRERGPCARRPVEALHDGRVVLSFESANAAAKNGFDNSAISKCCRGELLTHHGFGWRFAA